MPKGIKTIRWTIELAASEFRKPRERVSLALKTAGEKAGPDGKFSTWQILVALYESVALERAAKDAKSRQQIDEAEMVKNERDVQEGRLAYVSDMRYYVADLTTRFVQMIRQSSLRESEKRRWISEIALHKFEPTTGDKL